MPEVTLTGFIEIPAAERPAVLPLLAEHVRLTRAEPGCLAFSVVQRDGGDRFEVAERFRDRAAFDAHQRRAQSSAWGAATRHLHRDYRVEEALP
jgi:quinol monooxygenase YgiN